MQWACDYLKADYLTIILLEAECEEKVIIDADALIICSASQRVLESLIFLFEVFDLNFPFLFSVFLRLILLLIENGQLSPSICPFTHPWTFSGWSAHVNHRPPSLFPAGCYKQIIVSQANISSQKLLTLMPMYYHTKNKALCLLPIALASRLMGGTSLRLLPCLDKIMGCLTAYGRSARANLPLTCSKPSQSRIQLSYRITPGHDNKLLS